MEQRFVPPIYYYQIDTAVARTVRKSLIFFSKVRLVHHVGAARETLMSFHVYPAGLAAVDVYLQ